MKNTKTPGGQPGLCTAEATLKEQDNTNIVNAQAAFFGDVSHEILAAGIQAERRRNNHLAAADEHTRKRYAKLLILFGGKL